MKRFPLLASKASVQAVLQVSNIFGWYVTKRLANHLMQQSP